MFPVKRLNMHIMFRRKYFKQNIKQMRGRHVLQLDSKLFDLF